jgi:hypothetical protein
MGSSALLFKSLRTKKITISLPEIIIPTFNFNNNKIKMKPVVVTKTKVTPVDDKRLIKVVKNRAIVKSKTKIIIKKKVVVTILKLKNEKIHKLSFDTGIKERQVSFGKGPRRLNVNNLYASYIIVKEESEKETLRIAFLRKKEIDVKLKQMETEKIAVIEKEKVRKEVAVKDRVNTQLASNKKKKSHKPKISKVEPDINTDEVVFYDYSKKKGIEDNMVIAPLVKKLIDSGYSKDKAVKAEIQANTNSVFASVNINKNLTIEKIKEVKKKDTEASKLKKMFDDFNPAKMAKSEKAGDGKNKYDYSLLKDKVTSQKSASKKTKKKYNSLLNIKVDSVNIGKSVTRSISNFEIRFLDSQNDILEDFGKGYIRSKMKLKDEFSSRFSTIVAKDHVPVNLELIYENDKIQFNIPIITRSSFDDLLGKYKYNEIGGHILVELDEETEEIRIDGYSKKIYFNYKYKEVDPTMSEYSHILFIGVDPGNHILQYKNTKGDITSKIVYINDEEIFYESNFYKRYGKDTFKLRELDILSKVASDLNIDSEKVIQLTDDKRSKKINLNTYQFNNSLYPFGTRKYYELKHLKDSLFMGRKSSKSIEIPSESYISEILTKFDIDYLKGYCVVQLNLPKNKKAKSFSYDGLANSQFMGIDTFVLDENGQIFDEPDINTSRIFLKGNVGKHNGIISVKVKYFDNTTEYLTTFCSNETYLVEQL